MDVRRFVLPLAICTLALCPGGSPLAAEQPTGEPSEDAPATIFSSLFVSSAQWAVCGWSEVEIWANQRPLRILSNIDFAAYAALGIVDYSGHSLLLLVSHYKVNDDLIVHRRDAGELDRRSLPKTWPADLPDPSGPVCYLVGWDRAVEPGDEATLDALDALHAHFDAHKETLLAAAAEREVRRLEEAAKPPEPPATPVPPRIIRVQRKAGSGVAGVLADRTEADQ